MLKINIKNECISLKDIKPEILPEILSWYNKVEDFKYATGIDKPINLKYLYNKYQEAVICNSEFFSGIYDNSKEKLLGILKGRVRNVQGPAVWISSIIIDPDWQGKGFGRMTIDLLLMHLKVKYQINSAYVAVVEENISGMNFWLSMGFNRTRRMEKHLMMSDRKHDVIIMFKII